MLTTEQQEAAFARKDEERRLECIAKECVCAVCGSGMRAPWSPTDNAIILRCSRDKTHVGYVRPDRELQRLYRMRQSGINAGESTEAIDGEIQQLLIRRHSRKGGKSVTTSTELERYNQKGLITADDAMAVITTTPGWEKAPANVVRRAAMTCASYRVFPGVHVFLLPFKARSGETSWVVAFGIKATRLLASRRKAFRYVDGPRIAKEAEAKEHFQDQYDPQQIYAITRGEGIDGSSAEGWGWWPRGSAPYGMDKGNTAANMAEIRSERRFLDRLCPGELPTDHEVVDESFMATRPDSAAVVTVDEETGHTIDTTLGLGSSEIVDGEVREIPFDPPTSEPAKTEPPASQAPQQPKGSKLIGKDPSTFKPKNQADLVGGAKYFFQMEPDEVTRAIGGQIVTTPAEAADAWQVILGLKT